MRHLRSNLRRLTALSAALVCLFADAPAAVSLALAGEPLNATRITPPPPAPAAGPRANGRVAFDSNRDGNFEIYTSHPDGGGLARLTFNEGDDFLPVWSPDGRRIAFLSTRDGNAELYVMNADGSEQRRLTASPGVDEYPSWSPDSSKLVYDSERDGNYEIYVMNADGSGQTRLSRNVADDAAPRWSPDGSRIAFLSNRDGNYEIYSMGADGGDVVRLTNHPGDDLAPAWSPDGQKLAFESTRDDPSPAACSPCNYEVYVMSADGGQPSRLTHAPAFDGAPAWSPDGSRITFGSERDGDPEVYVMSADGGGQAKLAGGAGVDELPDWQAAQPQSGNPVDEPRFFVAQHYRDFLGREPDPEGWQFWTGDIEGCGADQGCREVKRIHVSAAFFLSIEFRETGYLAYRARKAAFDNLPGKPVPITRQEMLSDSQAVGSGVVVGAQNWEQKLEQNKQAYFDQLAASERFSALYPQSMTPEVYVDALNQNADGALSQAERDALVAELKGNAKTRAQALRAVAEDETLTKAEFNKAFVLMQYFGYLRRDPDGAPDSDFSGYNFWLGKLNEFGGDFIRAEMVKAFLDSIEYRQRFVQ
ncbi:MAG TPA: hypothetical protein VF621_06130 [Pyrinomonadaceae bacterium]